MTDSQTPTPQMIFLPVIDENGDDVAMLEKVYGITRDEACAHGHFDCATVEGGACANETYARLSRADAAPMLRLWHALSGGQTPQDPRGYRFAEGTADNPYTAVIREKYPDADEVTFVTGHDEDTFVVAHVSHRDGKINWFSDWTRADDLVAAGVLRRTFHTGHGDPVAQFVEYFYT